VRRHVRQSVGRTVLTLSVDVHEDSRYTRNTELIDGIRAKFAQIIWEEKKPVREIMTPVYESAS